MPAEVGSVERDDHHVSGPNGDLLLAARAKVSLGRLRRAHPAHFCGAPHAGVRLAPPGSDVELYDLGQAVRPSSSMERATATVAALPGRPGHLPKVPSGPDEPVTGLR